MKRFMFNLLMCLTGIAAAWVISGCAGQLQQPVNVDPVNHSLTITVDNTGGDVDVKSEEDEGEKAMESLNGKDGMKLSAISFVTSDTMFCYLYSGISVADVIRLDQDMTKVQALMPAIRKMEFFINSGGGDAFAGLALADRIEKAKKDGWHITARGNGIIASAAVPIFVVCSERFAAEGTIFMVHEAALWKWPGRESASDIAAQQTLMQILRDRYLGKMVNNTSIPYDKWREMEKATTWFTVKEAKAFGMLGPNPNN
jgi:ATP-dependent protease ClpP protease subunit